jgi:hypothetical protein
VSCIDIKLRLKNITELPDVIGQSQTEIIFLALKLMQSLVGKKSLFVAITDRRAKKIFFLYEHVYNW